MEILKGLQHPQLIWVHIFNDLNIGEITPGEQFTNNYVEEVYKSEHVRTATKQLWVTLDAKYEKIDLHKVMETQRKHLTTTQRNVLLNYYRNLNSCQMEHLALGKQIQYTSI